VGFGFYDGFADWSHLGKRSMGHTELDPKETWAFITGASYLIYIMCDCAEPSPEKVYALAYHFLIYFPDDYLEGVAYLPSAQGSVHVYSE
jgi:hypothetical protein